MRLSPVDNAPAFWGRGRLGRFWFVQPRYEVTRDGTTPQAIAGGPPALELLDQVLGLEADLGEPIDGPTFIMLPELSVPASEIETLRSRIVAARPNTIFVIGLAAVAQAEVLAIEPQLGDISLCGRPPRTAVGPTAR